MIYEQSQVFHGFSLSIKFKEELNGSWIELTQGGVMALAENLSQSESEVIIICKLEWSISK